MRNDIRLLLPLALMLMWPVITEAGTIARQNDSVAVTDTIKAKPGKGTNKSRSQSVIRFGAEYHPGQNEKQTAVDAFDLLMKMQIPKLDVREETEEIATLSGQAVNIYIDYAPASKEELQGLRPEDVMCVEVLDCPDDPRFESNRHVVNIIMQHYQNGGYTKLRTGGKLLSVDKIDAGVYSRFENNNWTIDVAGNGDWTHNRSDQSSHSETFRDFHYNGELIGSVNRYAVGGYDFISRSNNQRASVRAIYRTPDNFIQHRISLGRTALPDMRNRMEVTFSDGFNPGGEVLASENNQTLNSTVEGYYQFFLPRDYSLMASWGLSYGAEKSHSMYRLAEQEPIDNSDRKKIYSPSIMLQLSKKLDVARTLRMLFTSDNTYIDTRYSGTYNRQQDFLLSDNRLLVEYMQNWDMGLNIFARAGVSYAEGRLYDIGTVSKWRPVLGFEIQYQPNDKHFLSADGWWGTTRPKSFMANDDMVRINEMMCLKGNPKLHNSSYIFSSLSYTYVPLNILSLSAFVEYEGNSGKQAYRFYTEPDINGLIRQNVNSGFAHSLTALVSANLKLIKKTLSLRARAKASRVILTGCDRQTLNTLTADTYLQYTNRHWSAMLYYEAPVKMLDAWSYGVRTSLKCNYGLTVNLSFGDFKAMVRFSNWFRTNGYTTEMFNSSMYSRDSEIWNEDLSRSLEISLYYTIPYGKKVKNRICNQSAMAEARL